MKQLLFLVLLAYCAAAYTPLGGGICNATGCADATAALNDNVNCLLEVRLNTSVFGAAATCINDPALFSNKMFDCLGNTINGAAAPGTYGIYLDGQLGNTIRNCIITGFTASIYMDSSNHTMITNCTLNESGWGMQLVDSSFVDMVDNDFNDNDQEGLALSGSSHCNILDNNASVNVFTGIRLMLNSSLNTMDNNTAEGNIGEGIWLDESHNNTLTGNEAHVSQTGILLTYSNDNNITDDNDASNNLQYGIHLRYSNFTRVIDAVVNTVPGVGICLNDTTDDTVANGTFTLDNYGIYMNQTSNTVVTNCTVASNIIEGIHLETLAGNLVYNNIFNNTLNANVTPGLGGNDWNVTKQAATSIIGRDYIGGNLWVDPTGTGFSEVAGTCNPIDQEGICGSAYVLGLLPNADYLPLTYLNSSDTPPTVALEWPPEAENVSSSSITFNFTPVDDQGFDNCSLWTNESGVFAFDTLNQSSIQNDSTNTITKAFAANGTYLWNVQCCDNASQCEFAPNNLTVIFSGEGAGGGPGGSGGGISIAAMPEADLVIVAALFALAAALLLAARMRR